MKIAVVGIGGSGSAALRFLARAGHEVVGFEQFALGHTRGSSHGESRIIRYTYPDPFHTRLMARSYSLWNELESETKQQLFVRCGGVTFGPKGHPRLENTRQSLEVAGLDYEELSSEAVDERFPALALRDDEIALFQDKSGFLRSTRCVLAQAEAAEQFGAQLHTETAVQAIENCNGQVLISTESQTESFDAAIVTAGPWVGQLLEPLNLPVQVEQRQFVYLELAEGAEPECFEPTHLPVWIDAGDYYYGFPSDGVIRGVKFASHVAGVPFDPDSAERPVLQDNLQAAIAYGRQRMPALSDKVAHAQACLYTMTPDENFILDQAPGLENVTVVSGCSGHGFKFTILLGYFAAQMALGESFDLDLSPWKLKRFES